MLGLHHLLTNSYTVVLMIVLVQSVHIGRKVVANLPTDISTCNLGTVHLKVASVIACASLCISPQCTLYCLKGNECSLFSAKVNGRWVDEGTSGINYGLCYSTWYAHNDITKSIVASFSSSILKPERQPEFAYDGYYCFKVDGYCFTSSSESEPNWNAELGTTQNISSIKILTRGDGMPISTFQDIIVKFGDSSVYSDNPPFGSYSGPSPPEGTTVVITSAMPATGQYLQIASSNSIHLVICEVQILG